MRGHLKVHCLRLPHARAGRRTGTPQGRRLLKAAAASGQPECACMRFLKMEKRRLVARANSIGSACPTGMHAPGGRGCQGTPCREGRRCVHSAKDWRPIPLEFGALQAGTVFLLLQIVEITKVWWNSLEMRCRFSIDSSHPDLALVGSRVDWSNGVCFRSKAGVEHLGGQKI